MRHAIAAVLAVSFSAATAVQAQTVRSFKHIVVIVQENRTPDNIFGSMPSFEAGVDIQNFGKDSKGRTIPLTARPMKDCYDIAHSHGAFTQMYDNGAMDGAGLEQAKGHGCTIPPHPQFKFVTNTDVQPYFEIALNYGFANRMFQTNEGPSFPAHQFLFGGTSQISADSALFVAENSRGRKFASCTVPRTERVATINAMGVEQFPGVYPCFVRDTMANVLDSAGLSWTYYINGGGFGKIADKSIWDAPAAIRDICKANGHSATARCVGKEYRKHVVSKQAQVLTDIGDCALPAVSWIIPDGANSDHAGVTDGTGPSWVASIVNAVGTNAACAGTGEQYWNDTAILITWDDWGGWYDHVPPPTIGGWPNGWGANYIYGFRVPLLVVSAYTMAGEVENNTHDFGSILAFMESNFGLGHIGAGQYADAFSDNLSAFFTLSTPRPYSIIRAPLGADYFLNARPSTVGPDDDQ